MARANRTARRSTSGTRTAPDDRILYARYLLAACVAVVSAVMSYQALAELNTRGHIAGQWTWVWPTIFVVPETSGALAVIAAQRRKQGAVWSWFLLVTATAVSVAANVWAAPPDLLSRTVHGIVPVVGFVQVKDICNGIRDRLDAAAHSHGKQAVPVPAFAAGAVPRIITIPVREPVAVPPAPTAPPPEPEPAAPKPAPAPKARRSGTAKKAVGDIAFARHVKQVRPLVQANPKITGRQIGEILGTNDSYGRRVKRATTG